MVFISMDGQGSQIGLDRLRENATTLAPYATAIRDNHPAELRRLWRDVGPRSSIPIAPNCWQWSDETGIRTLPAVAVESLERLSPEMMAILYDFGIFAPTDITLLFHALVRYTESTPAVREIQSSHILYILSRVSVPHLKHWKTTTTWDHPSGFSPHEDGTYLAHWMCQYREFNTHKDAESLKHKKFWQSVSVWILRRTDFAALLTHSIVDLIGDAVQSMNIPIIRYILNAAKKYPRVKKRLQKQLPYSSHHSLPYMPTGTGFIPSYIDPDTVTRR